MEDEFGNAAEEQVISISPISLGGLPLVAELLACVARAAQSVKGARVHPFGSSVNGFGDQSSDVDLVLEASKPNLVKGLRLGSCNKWELAPKALDALSRGPLQAQGFQVVHRILEAKVPILKLERDGVECDLSCNNLLPFWNTRLLKLYVDINQSVVGLVQEVKAWARGKGVHGAPAGHLSSYSFTLLVIFYMQIRGALPSLQRWAEHRPQWYTEGAKKWNVAMDVELPPPEACKQFAAVQVSLQDFANFMTKEFHWGTEVVSVRIGRCLLLNAYPDLGQKLRRRLPDEYDKILHIEDPFDTDRNLNCVFSAGHNKKLWCALVEEASPDAGLRPARQAQTLIEPASATAAAAAAAADAAKPDFPPTWPGPAAHIFGLLSACAPRPSAQYLEPASATWPLSQASAQTSLLPSAAPGHPAPAFQPAPSLPLAPSGQPATAFLPARGFQSAPPGQPAPVMPARARTPSPPPPPQPQQQPPPPPPHADPLEGDSMEPPPPPPYPPGTVMQNSQQQQQQQQQQNGVVAGLGVEAARSSRWSRSQRLMDRQDAEDSTFSEPSPPPPPPPPYPATYLMQRNIRPEETLEERLQSANSTFSGRQVVDSEALSSPGAAPTVSTYPFHQRQWLPPQQPSDKKNFNKIPGKKIPANNIHPNTEAFLVPAVARLMVEAKAGQQRSSFMV
ncbi:unnamed protein product [Polarella glacialis]|uniref:Poly(A) RNA polymerase mitochondrial-like central palm domain-containing protein n=1 Tax=Polarella glacialis TaxID=89957 RepID=A0A813FII1_POLGL|nr:unnamed protein product [Polarella glacialis]